MKLLFTFANLKYINRTRLEAEINEKQKCSQITEIIIERGNIDKGTDDHDKILRDIIMQIDKLSLRSV